jgi:hypothetical protein
MTLPPPIRQHVLQSTCQQLLPAAEAGGAASNDATPVPITAANTTTAAHLMFFLMVHLLSAELSIRLRAKNVTIH